MKEPKQIGDMSRDLTHMIADMSYGGPSRTFINISVYDADTVNVEKARRLAKSAVPGATRTAQTRRYSCAQGCEHIEFAVFTGGDES